MTGSTTGGSFTIKRRVSGRGGPSLGSRFPGRPSSSRGSQSSRSGGGAGRRYRGGGRKKKGGDSIDSARFINKVDHAQIKIEEDYVPTNMYADFPFEARVIQAAENKGYITPTQIQDQAIPIAMAGKDLVGLSATGTGKTAAFLLPILHRLFTCEIRQALILAPTRELAIQIDNELHGLHGKRMQLFSTVVVGGVPSYRQIKQLRKTNHIVIGTPGRVMDLMKRGELDLSKMDTVVLDEADRMLDMGFIDDMRFVMQHVPKERQTLFFSATMSQEIQKLISEFLTDPTTISVKSRDTSEHVDQDVIRVQGRNKLDVLLETLSDVNFSKVIIFTQTKRGAEHLSNELHAQDISCTAIHGDLSHWDRQKALKRFIDGDVRVLVATDVAARGIDVKDISHVINYDIPQTYDDYIHRIGRTGRAGKIGHALTFVA